MKKYKYKYLEDTFILSIETVTIGLNVFSEITKLYINDILLLENNLSKTDCFQSLYLLQFQLQFSHHY